MQLQRFLAFQWFKLCLGWVRFEATPVHTLGDLEHANDEAPWRYHWPPYLEISTSMSVIQTFSLLSYPTDLPE
jgi:hypothetical protein